PLKSSTTWTPRSGMFARSRTVTVNGMSPMGQNTMHAGTVLLLADGTPAEAGAVTAAVSTPASRSVVADRFMGASSSKGEREPFASNPRTSAGGRQGKKLGLGLGRAPLRSRRGHLRGCLRGRLARRLGARFGSHLRRLRRRLRRGGWSCGPTPGPLQQPFTEPLVGLRVPHVPGGEPGAPGLEHAELHQVQLR